MNHLRAVLALVPRRLLLRHTASLTAAAPRLESMEPLVVRSCPGEAKLSISFHLNGSNKCMQRELDEPLSKVLARISNGLKSQGKSKKKRKHEEDQQEGSPSVTVVKLLQDGSEVCGELPNMDAWQEGSVLQVGEQNFSVFRNPPTFTTTELPVSLLVGFPVCPKLEVEFGDLEDCEFRWFKEDTSSAPAAGDGPSPESSWTEVGSSRVYVPSNQDIGHRLKLACTAKDGVRRGLATELVSASTVEAGPGVCTCDNRHQYTVREAEWPSMRVVSYNILADIYAKSELSRTVLYTYCAPYALELDYRQSLIKKELSGYNADIICLQEVDKGVFVNSLVPALDAFGLDGVFRIKDRQLEGLATFYRRSKFKLLSSHDIMLSDALLSDPIHSQLLEKLSATSSLKEKFLRRTTCLQVSILEDLSKPGRKVCVANSHLFWHPSGGNTRLVQMGVALKHLSHVIGQVAPGAPLVFCGDFNSTPSSGVLQLVRETSVPQEHKDWSSSGAEDACNMELDSCFPPLLSACGEPVYTNYVGGFQGCLDYIFIQPDFMKVEQVIPMPSHQEVTTYKALPSVAHPSDHIALVCDLHWNP